MKSVLQYLRRPWVIALAAVVIVSGVFLGYRAYRAGTTASASTGQTVRARISTLTAVVGATGSVRPNQSATLTFKTSGTVSQVYVQPGETVTKGEVLAQLDPASLPGKITRAQADLISAQDALDQLLQSNSAKTQAQVNLANAQKALSHAKYIQWVNLPGNRASAGMLLQAEANVDLAQEALNRAESSSNSAARKLNGLPGGSPLLSDVETAQTGAQGQLAAAQTQLATAQATLNWYLGYPTPADQAVIDATVVQAQAVVDDAQRAYDRVKDGPNADDVASAQAKVAAAQATVNESKVIAPFDGTVTAVSVHPGDQAAPGTAAVDLADLSKYLVDVQVSEVDINKVKSAQPATLTFDAISNRTYHAKVSEISMTGTVVSGVVNFIVTVNITDPEALIKPGMTAAVNITVNEVTGALVVPSRAVRTVNGQQVVTVLVNGKATAEVVKVGASSGALTQIVSGNVKEGDEIVVTATTTGTTTTGGGFGGGFFGRLFRGG